jgi:hypothetical protein
MSPIAAWELVGKTPTPIYGHVGVKYKNRVMIMGGSEGLVLNQSVFGTRTGKNIEPVFTNPNMTLAAWPAACLFNERIITTSIRDCFSSENGLNWDHLTDRAPFGTGLGTFLYGHQMVSFGKERVQLVIIGGCNPQGGLTNTDKVWKSINGKEWTETTFKGARFSGRIFHRCLVYNNRLWVMGGTDDTGAYLSDVWYTEDLEHWVKMCDNAPWGPCAGFGCCVWDRRMWVIGGVCSENQRAVAKTGVWYSRNGMNWKRSFDLPVATYYTFAHELDNRIHIFGGATQGPIPTDSIYRMNLG